MHFDIVRFNYPEAMETWDNLLANPTESPVWIGRNGGSDTDFVEKWDGTSLNDPYVANMKRLNGFYDLDDDVENLHRFKRMYLDSSQNMDLCTVHMSSIFGGALEGASDPISTLKLKYGLRQVMCWRFIENCTYFMESFQRWGKDRRILVVSPFSQTVQHQTSPERRGKLHIPQYAFPPCEFELVDTPITYNTPDWQCTTDLKGERNWFDTAERIFEEIARSPFDIAWLSCGSYAMYLGSRIKNELGKSAIYIGGMANVFFNIYNFRYSSTGHDTAVVNLDYQVESLENSTFYTETNTRNFPYSEGIRAYFGKKS